VSNCPDRSPDADGFVLLKSIDGNLGPTMPTNTTHTTPFRVSEYATKDLLELSLIFGDLEHRRLTGKMSRTSMSKVALGMKECSQARKLNDVVKAVAILRPKPRAPGVNCVPAGVAPAPFPPRGRGRWAKLLNT
jgi:hypothetical protein